MPFFSKTLQLPEYLKIRSIDRLVALCRSVCPPELKVSTPAHAKQPGWYLEFEFRVTQELAAVAAKQAARGKPVVSTASQRAECRGS